MKTSNPHLIAIIRHHDQDPRLRTVVMPYLSAGSNAGGPITTLSMEQSFAASLQIMQIIHNLQQ